MKALDIDLKNAPWHLMDDCDGVTDKWDGLLQVIISCTFPDIVGQHAPLMRIHPKRDMYVQMGGQQTMGLNEFTQLL